ncbi:MAG TPA: ANTAR domain-containing protein [Candidatus Choladousia intestinavium]|uniref:ANTAR domain-containing protein n=1 Tax=Candidatus Choladousia intestinavium TaxID=2840727 RepID=A0A9D1DA33_9FIRM|nr:ANTAR domain-containing protein [Candidatus Choladousia intestinavium]
MANIVVLFPKLEDAKSIRNLLTRRGYPVSSVCTSGAQALAAADHLGSGIIVCGYKFPDMIYEELYENVAPAFEMLLVASARALSGGVREGVVGVTMPLKAQELLESLEMIVSSQERRRRRKKTIPPKRSERERKLIEDAKALLMERNHMTEEEAHRYLQKTSMDSGTNMAETAEMLFSLMQI